MIILFGMREVIVTLYNLNCDNDRFEEQMTFPNVPDGIV